MGETTLTRLPEGRRWVNVVEARDMPWRFAKMFWDLGDVHAFRRNSDESKEIEEHVGLILEAWSMLVEHPGDLGIFGGTLTT